MTSKEARKKTRRERKWKLPLSLIITAIGMFAVCGLARHFWGPGPAGAQNQFRPASRSNTPQNPAPVVQGNQANGSELKIMAVVNSQQITRQQLAQECLRRYGDEVLENLVNKHLILMACNKRGIIISQQDVNEEITHIASKFGLSVDRYMSLLENERQIDPRQYANDIVWPMLALRRVAAEDIRVSSDEIQKMLDSELGPKVKVRIITTGNRDKAERLRQQAVADPDAFGTLAKDHSEDRASASAYGLIPPIRRNLGDPTVEQVAYSLQEGEISQVIAVANQYLILKCDQKIPATQVSINQVEEAKKQIVEHLRDQKLRSAGAKLFQQLQDEAQVKNIFNDPQLSSQSPGIAALLNSQRITVRELSEECVTRHGEEVLEGEINRLLLIQALKKRKLTVGQGEIDAEIERAALIYSKTKPDGSANVEAWLKEVTKQDGATVDLYVRDAVWPTVALKMLVEKTVVVTDEDMRKGFQANYGPRVEALAIVLNNKRQAQQVWDMARANPTDQFFGELAEQYSGEPVSKANSGRIPPIQQFGGQKMIEEEAFRLKPGELSGILEVGDKSIILRCLGRTKPVATDFNAVRNELYRDLHEKKLRLAMAKEFDRLHSSARIDNFLAGVTQSGRSTSPSPTAQRPGVSNRIPFTRSASRPTDRVTTPPQRR